MATNEKNRVAAEMITYLSIALGALAIVGGASSGGIALIGAVIYLTVIASAIQPFAVELAAGCHPITRNE
ncbi:MAG: hypothetical protein AB2810_18720 [Candidatus Thiodiazotropha endolucinida]